MELPEATLVEVVAIAYEADPRGSTPPDAVVRAVAAALPSMSEPDVIALAERACGVASEAVAMGYAVNRGDAGSEGAAARLAEACPGFPEIVYRTVLARAFADTR